MSSWRPIKTFRGPNRREVDVWMHIYASPRSMGMSDSFRVTNAYKVNGKWFHLFNGKEEELYSDYITHWMPIPKPPSNKETP